MPFTEWIIEKVAAKISRCYHNTANLSTLIIKLFGSQVYQRLLAMCTDYMDSAAMAHVAHL